MNLMHQMNEWSSKHHPKWLVILRVLLGLCLFIKGIGFIQNSVLLSGLLAQTSFLQNASWLNSVIPWLHLLGGSMILAGLFTRFWALVQIPILLGAVFFVNARSGIFAGQSDLLFSISILILLAFFFIEGGGPLSLDNYFRSNSKK
jgi:putative oxidoreductase